LSCNSPNDLNLFRFILWKCSCYQVNPSLLLHYFVIYNKVDSSLKRLSNQSDSTLLHSSPDSVFPCLFIILLIQYHSLTFVLFKQVTVVEHTGISEGIKENHYWPIITEFIFYITHNLLVMVTLFYNLYSLILSLRDAVD